MEERKVIKKDIPFVGGMSCTMGNPLDCPHYLKEDGVSRSCYMIHYPQENYGTPRLDYKCKFLGVSNEKEKEKEGKPKMKKGAKIAPAILKAILNDMLDNGKSITISKFAEKHQLAITTVMKYQREMNQKAGREVVKFLSSKHADIINDVLRDAGILNVKELHEN